MLLGIGVSVGGRGVFVQVAGVRLGVLVGRGVLGVYVGAGVFVGLGVFEAAGVVFTRVGYWVFVEAGGSRSGAEYTFRVWTSPVVVA